MEPEWQRRTLQQASRQPFVGNIQPHLVAIDAVEPDRETLLFHLLAHLVRRIDRDDPRSSAAEAEAWCRKVFKLLFQIAAERLAGAEEGGKHPTPTLLVFAVGKGVEPDRTRQAVFHQQSFARHVVQRVLHSGDVLGCGGTLQPYAVDPLRRFGRILSRTQVLEYASSQVLRVVHPHSAGVATRTTQHVANDIEQSAEKSPKSRSYSAKLKICTG